MDLVNQAAEVVMSIEAQAAEFEVRARNLARMHVKNCSWPKTIFNR